MAKDDYFVIMCRILSYLYAVMKEGDDFNPEVVSYERLKIPERYWAQVIDNMLEKGYITGVSVLPVLGNNKIVKWIDPMITQDGVQFLQENSLMSKAKEMLKTIKEIVPGI